MQALTELQAYGYQAELSAPDKIRLTWTRSDPPDPAKVEPLLAELKARKAEALEAMRGTLEVDLATQTRPATIYRGAPTPEAVDVADRILTHLADLGRPVAEAEILAALGGDALVVRNILHRLAVDGIAEALPGGLYQIPAYPPRAADLPAGCPLLAGPVPAGCCFHPKLLARLLAEGALPLPSGRCPLRTACKVGRENGVKC